MVVYVVFVSTWYLTYMKILNALMIMRTKYTHARDTQEALFRLPAKFETTCNLWFRGPHSTEWSDNFHAGMYEQILMLK